MDGDEPAFARPQSVIPPTEGAAEIDYGANGLTKREYFAIECLKAIYSAPEALKAASESDGEFQDELARMAIIQADALIAALSKEGA